MMTWLDGNVRHELSHWNTERRAGRTNCGRYEEFWPKDLAEDMPVTCLSCVTSPAPEPSELHAQRAREDVDERREDVIRACGPQHGKWRSLYHDDGRCWRCGYA